MTNATAIKPVSAAEARKKLKTTPLNLQIEILPNISLEKEGDWVELTFEASRQVPNDGKPFMVHDVVYKNGSLTYVTTGKDKTHSDIKPEMRVSLKGNARLDRGFSKTEAGKSVLIEYMGKVDVGQGRSANDYLFELIG